MFLTDTLSLPVCISDVLLQRLPCALSPSLHFTWLLILADHALVYFQSFPSVDCQQLRLGRSDGGGGKLELSIIINEILLLYILARATRV